MIKRLLIIIICISTSWVASADTVKKQLEDLFSKAEDCYLIDDYQQLWNCITHYYDILNRNSEQLGDSLSVYEAYYNKMCGNYYYGFADDDTFAAEYSEQRYLKSLSVFSQRNSTDNVMTIHEELAQLYYKVGAYGSASDHLDVVLDYYERLCYNLGILSAEPKYFKLLSHTAICNARLGRFEKALPQIDEALKYYKKGKDADYYEMMRRKAKILMLQADTEGKGDFRTAKACYEQYVNERCRTIGRQLGSMSESQREQYWLATHRFLYDCYRLGANAPEMLYDLALFSKGFLIDYEHHRDAVQTRWEQVRNVLGNKDCAIEFVQYYGKQDEKRVGCLVLHKSSKKPVFIDLLSSDSVLSLPLADQKSIGSAIESPHGYVKNKLYDDTRLSGLIWTPRLMAVIGDAENIFFAPDGMIHLLAIEYLMPDPRKMCYRLSSTRKLTEKKKTLRTERALLCGGVDYDANYQPVMYGNDTIAYRYLSPQISGISYLPQTRVEVDSIYGYRHQPNDTLLIGADATDETFLKLLQQHYDVVHISTHGFYCDRIGIHNDIKPLFNDDAMSKSGILLAGASSTLSDASFNDELFDGVLSAEELSKQDFSQTGLVVLSACQTGNGRLTEDGIYGVQRGLKQAGAQSMIVSLWDVDDYSTSLLMKFFYQELESQVDKNLQKALLTARQRLKEEERTIFIFDDSTFSVKTKTLHYNTPNYLNPFIIIDAY